MRTEPSLFHLSSLCLMNLLETLVYVGFNRMFYLVKASVHIYIGTLVTSTVINSQILQTEINNKLK